MSCHVICHVALAELRNAFELQIMEQHHFILSTQTPEEKNAWMAALVGLQTARHTHIHSTLLYFRTERTFYCTFAFGFTVQYNDTRTIQFAQQHSSISCDALWRLVYCTYLYCTRIYAVCSSANESPKCPKRSAICRFTCRRPPFIGLPLLLLLLLLEFPLPLFAPRLFSYALRTSRVLEFGRRDAQRLLKRSIH